MVDTRYAIPLTWKTCVSRFAYMESMLEVKHCQIIHLEEKTEENLPTMNIKCTNGFTTQMTIYVLDILTQTQAYRPRKLNRWVNFDVESEFKVDNTKKKYTLAMGPKQQELRIREASFE